MGDVRLEMWYILLARLDASARGQIVALGEEGVPQPDIVQDVHRRPGNCPWTVVDRGTEVRGPLFFYTWTVVDRTVC